MTNVASAMEIRRRGMAAIEEALERGPVLLVRRNKSVAVVLGEDDYRRLPAPRVRACAASARCSGCRHSGPSRRAASSRSTGAFPPGGTGDRLLASADRAGIVAHGASLRNGPYDYRHTRAFTLPAST